MSDLLPLLGFLAAAWAFGFLCGYVLRAFVRFSQMI